MIHWVPPTPHTPKITQRVLGKPQLWTGASRQHFLLGQFPKVDMLPHLTNSVVSPMAVPSCCHRPLEPSAASHAICSGASHSTSGTSPFRKKCGSPSVSPVSSALSP